MEGSNFRENLLIGMGNPLLDISANVEKEFLAKYELKENDAILADEKHINLYTDITENHKVEYIAGGSVQNALRVCQWLIGKPKITTFFGCVGEDKFGKILYDRATADGVNVKYQYNEKEPTGTCAALITDHHRSLCANLGSANSFTIDHLRKPENRILLETAQFYYVSGFFLTVSPPSIMEVAKLALSRNCHFLMNLNAPFICEHFVEPLMQVMPYIDVIFGNETEAETFASSKNFKTKDIKEIALKIHNLPKQNESRKRIVIITQGIHPVILVKDGEITEFPVTQLPPEKMIDTNGAGDAFVGGFLSQYIRGKDLNICVKCGIWAAAQIIQRSGCTFEGTPMFKE